MQITSTVAYNMQRKIKIWLKFKPWYVQQSAPTQK